MSTETAASVCGLKWSDTVVGPHECKDPAGHKPGMHSCGCGTYLVGDGAQRPARRDMIDPATLRHLASDLDAKVDTCRLNAVGFGYRGNPTSARYCDGQADAYADVAARIRVMLADENAKQRESTDCAGRAGYDQAVAALLDVSRRTGSPAARWAAEYLAADPDGRAP